MKKEIIKMLQEDNLNMRDAGCELVTAAIFVAKEYDGIHRLMLAVSKWCEVIANEGGRDKL